jgi:hypothetical protein
VDTSEGAEADMEDYGTGPAPERAGTDASGVQPGDWAGADDPFGDEAAFPSIWQQLDGAESVTLD